MIKKLLAAGVVVALCCGIPALAEDTPVLGDDGPTDLSPPAPQATAPIWNWSGFYAGISGGWGFNPHSDVVFPVTPPARGETSGKGGGIVGGTLGVNWQNGSLVAGIEGDISWADIKTSGAARTTVPCGPLCGILVPPFIVIGCTSPCESTLSALATARGRVGFALPSSLLIFGTGGGAFGWFSNSEAGFGTANGGRIGWTAGGGIEGALGQNWTWKAEYLFVNFIHKQIPYNQHPNGLQQDKFQTGIARIGVNYKFGSD